MENDDITSYAINCNMHIKQLILATFECIFPLSYSNRESNLELSQVDFSQCSFQVKPIFTNYQIQKYISMCLFSSIINPNKSCICISKYISGNSWLFSFIWKVFLSTFPYILTRNRLFSVEYQSQFYRLIYSSWGILLD